MLIAAVIAFAGSAGALFWLEKCRSSKFEKSSYHDPLTGLANRAYLDLYLELVTSRAESKEEVVALAFLDLNGFKKARATTSSLDSALEVTSSKYRSK